MNCDQLLTTLMDLDLLERDLNRELTKDEINFVIENGKEAFLTKILSDENRVDLFKKMNVILSTLFTQPVSEYEKAIKTAGKDVVDVLKKIINDIETVKTDPVDEAIKKLKAGEVIELSSELIDKVIDKLWNTESNIRIEVKNNKIRLR